MDKEKSVSEKSAKQSPLSGRNGRPVLPASVHALVVRMLRYQSIGTRRKNHIVRSAAAIARADGRKEKVSRN